MSSAGIYFKGLEVTFCLRAVPKLDHLSAIFQKLHMEGNTCFNVVSQLLYITQQSHKSVDACHFPLTHCCARKKPTPILSLLSLTQAV